MTFAPNAPSDKQTAQNPHENNATNTAHGLSEEDLNQIIKDAKRYRKVRAMSLQTYTDLYNATKSTGAPFDLLIDIIPADPTISDALAQKVKKSADLALSAFDRLTKFDRSGK